MVNVITQLSQQLCSHCRDRLLAATYTYLASYVYDYAATTYTYLYDSVDQLMERATTTSRTTSTITHTYGKNKHYDSAAESSSHVVTSPSLSTTCSVGASPSSLTEPPRCTTTITHHPFTSETTQYTALYYYGYRYYSSELGRWINRDPIGKRGGAHLYGFVHNSVTFSIDYLGMSPFPSMGSMIPGPGYYKMGGSSPSYWSGLPVKSYTSSPFSRAEDYVKSWFSEEFPEDEEVLASVLPSVGLQLSGVFTVATGVTMGENVQFFPETCEIGLFGFSTSRIMWTGSAADMKRLRDIGDSFIGSMPVGAHIGISGDVVVASPIGSGPHGVDSWVGEFKSIGGDFVGGVNVFWGTGPGKLFPVKNWLGITAGIGYSVGGSYQATSFVEHARYDLKKNAIGRCACRMARKSLAMSETGLVIRLLKKFE